MAVKATQVTKIGLGTLVLQGTNTFSATGGNGLQILGGTLQLDYANLAGAGPILNNTTLMQLTLGTGTNASLSTGGTLLITAGPTAAVTQNFSTTLYTAKDNFITLNSQGAAINLGLGTGLTRNTIGATLTLNGNAFGCGDDPIRGECGEWHRARWGSLEWFRFGGSQQRCPDQVYRRAPLAGISRGR